MVVASSRRRSTVNSLTARVLVLGDKHVGKSASIVRYTTGRFIQEYSSWTNDWLYRHSLGFDEKRNAFVTIEILEQRDIQLNNKNGSTSSSQNQLDTLSLSERVALDQENSGKSEILNRVLWADAFVVMYAINDIDSYNKAMKYLNLITSNSNKSLEQSRSASENRLTPPTPQKHKLPSNSISSVQGNPIRRPILLLANKSDLELTGRRVSRNDGLQLANKYKTLFNEISVAKSNRMIDDNLSNLVDLIDPSSFSVSSCIYSDDEQQSFSQNLRRQRHSLEQVLDSTNQRTLPTIELALSTSTLPIWLTGVAASNLLERTIDSKLESDVFLPDSIAQESSVNQRISDERKAKVKRSSSNGSRYKNLKSSFKRASMAIVSTRALLKEASKGKGHSGLNGSCINVNDGAHKRDPKFNDQDCDIIRGSVSSTSSISQPAMNLATRDVPVEHHSNQSIIHPINITSRAASVNSYTNISTDSNINKTANPSSYYANLVSNRLKRSLMKYKNRRRTVAFDSVTHQSNSMTNQTGNPSPGPESARASIDRSSSSLSNADNWYYRTLFVSLGASHKRPSSSIGSTSSGSISGNSGRGQGSVSRGGDRQTEDSHQQRSQSGLTSRGSISCGSYEESGDELDIKYRSPAQRVQVMSSRGNISNSNKLPPLCNTKRASNDSSSNYCLESQQVKLVSIKEPSVQTTSSSTLKVKRAFCRNLFKSSLRENEDLQAN